MKKQFIEIFGWYGTFAIIGAYFLVSFSIVQSNTLTFQLINLTGALGLFIVSFYKKAYQLVVLNVIWLFIALVAIAKILF